MNELSAAWIVATWFRKISHHIRTIMRAVETLRKKDHPVTTIKNLFSKAPRLTTKQEVIT